MRSGTDPLMAQSALLSRDIAEQKDLYLFEGLRPNPRFHIRKEAFGTALIRDTHVSILPTQYTDRLLACNPDYTLRDIQDKFGQPTLDWIGALAEQGLVSWQ